MKLKLVMLLITAVISSAATAQKNKKSNKAQANEAVASNASKIKKAESRTWSLDSVKTKQTASAKKMKKAGKTTVPASNLGAGDDPFGKQANGLGDGEDPFDKAPRGMNRKKAAAQEAGIKNPDSLKTKKTKNAQAANYVNQEVNYMQQPAPGPQAAQTNEAASGVNSNTSGINVPANPGNVGQASTVDKSPATIHVRFDMENIEATKKELTRGLSESENQVGWYNKLRVQSAAIDNLKIYSVTLHKLDGTTTIIPVNETILKGGTSTSLFYTGLKNETKNNITILEKINKVSVFYELLDPTAKKKNNCAIQVYFFKSE